MSTDQFHPLEIIWVIAVHTVEKCVAKRLLFHFFAPCKVVEVSDFSSSRELYYRVLFSNDFFELKTIKEFTGKSEDKFKKQLNKYKDSGCVCGGGGS
jgi:hypothetical protein